MSDSSNSSPAAIDRAAARLALLAPAGRRGVFLDRPYHADGMDAFAVIAGSEPETPLGFVRVAGKPHRRKSTLGAAVHKRWQSLPAPQSFKDAAVAFCRATGISAVVGARTTWDAVPGLQEYFFVRTDAGSTASGRGERLWDAVLSAGGLGYLPLVGATAASAAVCLVGFAAAPFVSDTLWRALMFLLAVVSAALCAAGEKRGQRIYVAEDPREVVLDEVAGMAAALALAGSALWPVVFAFFAFRFFDIFKIGVHWIEERRWAGGIVWDDLLAGIYAGACVWIGSVLIAL